MKEILTLHIYVVVDESGNCAVHEDSIEDAANLYGENNSIDGPLDAYEIEFRVPRPKAGAKITIDAPENPGETAPFGQTMRVVYNPED